MKTLFLIIILFSFNTKGQIAEVDSFNLIRQPVKKDFKTYELYEKSKKRYNSLKLYDKRIIYRENWRRDFLQAYSKLLKLKSYNNLKVQNALLKDYLIKYKEEKLKYKFNSKLEVQNKINKFDNAFIQVLTLLYNKNLMDYYKKQASGYDEYLKENNKK